MACDMSKLNQLIGVNERIKFFDESQGGQRQAIIWHGNLIWESGSNREIAHGSELNLVVLMDVDWFDLSDFRQVRLLLCWKQKFAERKLEDAVKIFEAAKDELKNRGDSALFHGSQPPTKSEIKELRKLRHSVRQWESKLSKLLEKLNPSPAPESIKYSKEQQEIMAENQRQAYSFLNEINKIEV